MNIYITQINSLLFFDVNDDNIKKHHFCIDTSHSSCQKNVICLLNNIQKNKEHLDIHNQTTYDLTFLCSHICNMSIRQEMSNDLIMMFSHL
jgi:hypothetical protein